MFYTFIFIALLLTGVGPFPIPEDIIVLSAGIGIQQELGDIVAIFFIILFGIIISDTVIFGIGKKLGEKIFKIKIFSFFIPQEKVNKVRKIFGDHSRKIVFIGRFTSGFRPVVLFTSGMSGLRFYDFLICDILASLIYIPLFLFFGYRFSYDILRFFEDTRRVYHIVEVMIISSIVVWFAFKLSRKIFNNKNMENDKCLKK